MKSYQHVPGHGGRAMFSASDREMQRCEFRNELIERDISSIRAYGCGDYFVVYGGARGGLRVDFYESPRKRRLAVEEMKQSVEMLGQGKMGHTADCYETLRGFRGRRGTGEAS